MNLEAIQNQLKQFAKDRDWEKYHSPKNLSMALSNEVGEFVEIFQWLTEKESSEIMQDPSGAARVKEELADVFLYLVRIADVLNVDLFAAAKDKISSNQKRFRPK